VPATRNGLPRGLLRETYETYLTPKRHEYITRMSQPARRRGFVHKLDGDSIHGERKLTGQSSKRNHGPTCHHGKKQHTRRSQSTPAVAMTNVSLGRRIVTWLVWPR
jgi:hypothetical protein